MGIVGGNPVHEPEPAGRYGEACAVEPQLPTASSDIRVNAAR